MKSGLLWYDSSDRTLAEKLAPAAKRYTDKYGTTPDTCFVNPGDAPGVPAIGKITIRSTKTIMPNYLWLGVSKAQEETVTIQ